MPQATHVVATCFAFISVVFAFTTPSHLRLRACIVRRRRALDSGKGFGPTRDPPREPEKKEQTKAVEALCTPSVKTVKIREVEPYRGPTRKLESVEAAIEISDYGIVLEVGPSAVVDGELGLFVRTAPGVKSATLPSGLVLGGYAEGGFKFEPPAQNEVSSNYVIECMSSNGFYANIRSILWEIITLLRLCRREGAAGQCFLTWVAEQAAWKPLT